MRTIGIIGAMDLEVEKLISSMKEKKEVEYARRKFYVGKLENANVVLARCGVGKVNAALTVQMMVDKFNITDIINTGVAGSLDEKIDIGDMVLATGAVYHDVEAVAFGYERGQVPQMDVFEFPTDKGLVDLAEKSCLKVNPDIKVFKGRIASGDQFIADKETKTTIKKYFSPLCVEMEGCAMAHAAYVNNINCLIIRAISDKADDSAEEDYPSFEKKAAEHSAKMVIEMMKNI
ncbi:MAG: 5'-methylthioadenosine/adenosylhomocysteine nucleosidase [Lachnospiraceae bacterium]|jgi:adenosylhomocysteine nucleosidase|nr:5'-methylthioadenosine/adenosylhomocysteine nucleosidase [Lachnospiraceae bacterium]MBQ9862657.1 5'-methylthioadenosine/adenosylhomocysteine nucleosidase [Lachnospiraceae bacterium]MCR4934540.1 5'-methylthioadenosine/adenosylhomocysteine nucleosidase [Lachnospiraceae bacterium]